MEKERRKGRAIVFAMALALAVAAALAMLLLLPDKGEGNGIISSVSAGKGASASGKPDAAPFLMSDASPSSRPGAVASSLPEEGAREEVPASSVRISGLPEETLSLLRCTEGQLAEELKEFFNANGFADVSEAAYEGETVISHGERSVSAFFSLERDGGAYEICCVYSRDDDSRAIDIWE